MNPKSLSSALCGRRCRLNCCSVPWLQLSLMRVACCCVCEAWPGNCTSSSSSLYRFSLITRPGCCRRQLRPWHLPVSRAGAKLRLCCCSRVLKLLHCLPAPSGSTSSQQRASCKGFALLLRLHTLLQGISQAKTCSFARVLLQVWMALQVLLLSCVRPRLHGQGAWYLSSC